MVVEMAALQQPHFLLLVLVLILQMLEWEEEAVAVEVLKLVETVVFTALEEVEVLLIQQMP